MCCNGSSGDDCSGHGTCVTFKCHCAAGFTNFECATLACPHDCTNHGICYNNGTLRVLLRGRLGRAWLRNAQLPERWGSGLGEGGSYQAAADDLGVGADCSERGAAATGAPREATVAAGPERLGQQ